MEICVWCMCGIKSNDSKYYGLCFKCRNTKKGKIYLKSLKENQGKDFEKNEIKEDKKSSDRFWSKQT